MSLYDLGGTSVPVGTRGDLLLKVSESYTGDRLSIPVTVTNGVDDGPTVFVTAAIHGDELNGIAIVRELLTGVTPARLAGTLVCVPMVNVLGVQFHSRYLPDRRDLNRCFPGSAGGSTASRLANTLMTEVVTGADAGIDLHTATNRRTNAPQVRVRLDDPAAARLGHAFGAPFLVHASLRPGSLRDAADKEGVPVLTYEGGEAMRFEDDVIATGTAGIMRVMGALGMLAPEDVPAPPSAPVRVSDETHWVRAERGGVLDLLVGPGDEVAHGQPLWTVVSPFGHERNQMDSPYAGVVIGLTTLPLVNPGDAVVHLAVLGRHDRVWIDDPTDEEDADGDEDRSVG